MRRDLEITVDVGAAVSDWRACSLDTAMDRFPNIPTKVGQNPLDYPIGTPGDGSY